VQCSRCVQCSEQRAQAGPRSQHARAASWLRPPQGEKLVFKPGKGAFYATGLEEHLKQRGITHLIFAGVTAEVTRRPAWPPAWLPGRLRAAAWGRPLRCSLRVQRAPLASGAADLRPARLTGARPR
jgi:hypothetical protein